MRAATRLRARAGTWVLSADLGWGVQILFFAAMSLREDIAHLLSAVGEPNGSGGQILFLATMSPPKVDTCARNKI